MEQLTTTPFGRRPVTAGLVARVAANRQAAKIETMDKWSLFRELSAARAAFGLKDRTLLVLNALLSFLPGKTLEDGKPLVVFPSNLALADRAHGMAESTLRRHLCTLVESGLIARHDSPNGKRYAHRNARGDIARAFGFDLRPLLLRAGDVIRAAEEMRVAKAALFSTRETITLMKRDALKLTLYAQENALPGPWDTILDRLTGLTTNLRRKLALGDLQQIEAQLAKTLTEIRVKLDPKAAELSANDSQNERHYQNSDKDSCESEQREEVKTKAPVTSKPPQQIPLHMVLEACPDLLPYCDGRPQTWRDLIGASGFVRGMMGISASAWEDAQHEMGAEAAAVTLACILQRFTQIKNPGGYLRSLSAKAALGSFSTGPMVMALLNAKNRVAV
jgi:replication initiation protein RepC